MLNMLNTQQSQVLNQVTGTDQPRDDVELTELLPVRQSRIRENGTFKDADATDALKVLRSFAGGDCNDEQGYQLREFDFCERIDRGQDKRRRTEKGSSSENERKSGGPAASKESLKRNTRNVRGPTKRTTLGRRARASRSKPKLSSGISYAKSKSFDAKDETCRKEDLSENEDEESTYLDLERGKDFNDEVYVFRREVDSRKSPERRDTTTDGSLFDRRGVVPPHRENQKKVVKEGVDDKENERKSSKSSSSEKELSVNINAIIQSSNYLLERENNNVVQQNQNKIETAAAAAATDKGEGEGEEDDEKTTGKQRLLLLGREEEDRAGNEGKKYCCVVCEARFKGSGGLRNHYKIVHGAGPIFKCDECGKEFPLKERLKLHVRTHTGFKPYKCPECDKSFARGGQLVQHRRTHSQVKPYRCALCAGTFTCAANLALHVKRHNGQKDHKCEICGRAFVRRDALKKHLECLHRDVKSFLCVICNKTFKGHLPQHMRTHARDRPHGCATCGQRFAQKSQLTVHQRTHSGQRPFRCLVCWQAFAHSTALKLHTRRHTGERPFKCAECNAGFTQLPHWKKHMKCIHGRNEPYGCKRCKSFFRIKNDLESHEKTCHPEAALSTPAAVDGAPPVEATATAASASASAAAAAAAAARLDVARLDKLQEKTLPAPSKYRVMSVERMRLLLAVLLKRISRQERLDELGFGKRLIDEVLQDSLISAGKDPATGEGEGELETLTKNLEIFLKWTVPKEHWEHFRKLNKTPEDILETLTVT